MRAGAREGKPVSDENKVRQPKDLNADAMARYVQQNYNVPPRITRTGSHDGVSPVGVGGYDDPFEGCREDEDYRGDYDESEQDVLLHAFVELLWQVTRDGGRKRSAGEKPPWWRDDSHEAAAARHVARWRRGESVDPDSGAHPLVHAAWRYLAVAYQEEKGQVDPGEQ